MRAVIEIPSNKRKEILEKSELLISEDMRYPEPVQIFTALSKFQGKELDGIIVETLRRKKKGEDYLPILLALSEIKQD